MILEEARAYESQVVNAAQGEAARFESLLVEYAKAPEITKERLYIESMESVLSKSSKVMVGTGDSGNQLMYLPIDQLMNGSSGNRSAERPTTQVPNEYIPQPSSQNLPPRTTTTSRSRTRGSN